MSLDKIDDLDDDVEVEGGEGEEVFVEDDEAEAGKDGKAAGADDERLGADPDAPTADEVEKKRQARREKRKRQKEWIARDRRELEMVHGEVATLRKQIADLTKGQGAIAGQTQLSRIDGARTTLKHQLEQVDEQLEAAVTASDGAGAREATKLRDEINSRLGKLDTARERLVAATKGEGKADSGDEPDDEAVQRSIRVAQSNTRIFLSRNKWYDGKNKDSAKAKQVEAEIKAEGYTPDRADYWQEMESRLKEALPHRYEAGAQGNDEDDDDDDDLNEQDTRGAAQARSDAKGGKTGAKGGPVIAKVAGSKEGVSGKKGTTYKISAERKEAMIAAGIWDDIPHRNRMIKKYAAYDKQHGIK